MTIKRLTKQDIREATGTFNPVGHVVLAFADDAVTAKAAEKLRAGGFSADDILSYTSPEVLNRLREMVRTASEAAGFGYEITLMRRYMTLASEGCGWLIVFAPDEDQVKRVAAIAKQFAARSAVHYGRFASEDLV